MRPGDRGTFSELVSAAGAVRLAVPLTDAEDDDEDGAEVDDEDEEVEDDKDEEEAEEEEDEEEEGEAGVTEIVVATELAFALEEADTSFRAELGRAGVFGLLAAGGFGTNGAYTVRNGTKGRSERKRKESEIANGL